MKNTKKEGILRFFIYREGKSKEFTAVCLELGLIEVGQNPDYLKQSIVEAAKGYIHTVVKEDLPEKLLNVKPSKEHSAIYSKILASLKEEAPKKTLNDVLAFSKPINAMLAPCMCM